MKKRRLRIHKQTLHLMNDPEYIYIWVNPKELVIAICACEKSTKDALKVPASRECEIYSANLIEEIRKTNLQLFEECTYRLNGVISQGKKVAKFNILESIGNDRDVMR